MSEYDVTIIGAGIQGLFCAYSLTVAGITPVCVIDTVDYVGGRSTTRSAAMLTRITGHESTTLQAHASIRSYKEVFETLREAGRPVDFGWCGFALVGLDESHAAEVRAEYDEHEKLGIPSELYSGAMINEASEGFFKYPDSSVALLCPEDGYVEVASLIDALHSYLASLGVVFRIAAEAVRIESDEDGVTGVQLRDGEIVRARNVVNAAGVLAGTVGSWVGREIPIRPSKKNLVSVSGLGKRFRSPIVECADDGWYFRPAKDGLVLGIGKGNDEPLDLAAAGDPEPDDDVVEQAKAYLMQHTVLTADQVQRLEYSAWAGYRPIHARDSESVGRAPAHLPLFGDPGAIAGYYESCGWGEFGVTLGPAGGNAVAQEIVNAGRRL